MKPVGDMSIGNLIREQKGFRGFKNPAPNLKNKKKIKKQKFPPPTYQSQKISNATQTRSEMPRILAKEGWDGANTSISRSQATRAPPLGPSAPEWKTRVESNGPTYRGEDDLNKRKNPRAGTEDVIRIPDHLLAERETRARVLDCGQGADRAGRIGGDFDWI